MPTKNTGAIERTIERLSKISTEAAGLLKSLPEQVAEALIRGVPSPRLLAIGLLAATKRSPIPVLAMHFKIPKSWVIEQRDACLRSMRVVPEGQGRHIPPHTQEEK